MDISCKMHDHVHNIRFPIDSWTVLDDQFEATVFLNEFMFNPPCEKQISELAPAQASRDPLSQKLRPSHGPLSLVAVRIPCTDKNNSTGSRADRFREDETKPPMQ